MYYNLKPTLTNARKLWLETLLQGPAVRTSKVGCDCMRLGWTEWQTNESGEITGLDKITDAGREILNKANKSK